MRDKIFLPCRHGRDDGHAYEVENRWYKRAWCSGGFWVDPKAEAGWPAIDEDIAEFTETACLPMQ